MARIVGPFLLAAAVAVLLRMGQLDLLFPAFFRDTPLVLITGVFTFTLGLIGFAAHHRFDSPAAIAVTVIVAAAALRGLVLMLAPEFSAVLAHTLSSSAVAPPIVAVLTLVVGVWLTLTGWFSRNGDAT